MSPETEYARIGDLHLAYQVLGTGPPDILLLDQWFSHMEAQWEVPPLADFRERLASFGRLIMFDKRGTGLSDPVSTTTLPTIDEWMDDVPTILDAVGSEKAVLVTNIGGGIMAMPFAAAHPERVASLVLVDCFARFLVAPDFPIGAPREALDQALEEAEKGGATRSVRVKLSRSGSVLALDGAHTQARDEILFEVLPPRRLRVNPRVVKRRMSNYAVKRPEHRRWPPPSRPWQDAIRVLPL